MSFAQLLQDPVLLSESIALPISRIVEEEFGLVQNGDLIAVLKFSVLISPDNSTVDKSPVAGKIFE